MISLTTQKLMGGTLSKHSSNNAYDLTVYDTFIFVSILQLGQSWVSCLTQK
jgi:hypothetical protein